MVTATGRLVFIADFRVGLVPKDGCGELDILVWN
jgi:hypothetical protein